MNERLVQAHADLLVLQAEVVVWAESIRGTLPPCTCPWLCCRHPGQGVR